MVDVVNLFDWVGKPYGDWETIWGNMHIEQVTLVGRTCRVVPLTNYIIGLNHGSLVAYLCYPIDSR